MESNRTGRPLVLGWLDSAGTKKTFKAMFFAPRHARKKRPIVYDPCPKDS